MTTKEIIKKYWLVINDRNWSVFQTLVDENIIYELPQTREMIKGCPAFKDFNENYPGKWTIEVVQIIAEEKKATSKILFKDNDIIEIAISFFEIENNKIFKIEEFWPEKYEPPVRNSKYIIRY